MLADLTWFKIFRHVRGNPVAHSRGGVIDAVAAESVDNALAVARLRNPVRSCEYLEAKPVPFSQHAEAKAIRMRRQREIKEFKELMGVQDEHDISE